MSYLQGSFPLIRKQLLAPGVFDFTVCCPPIVAQAHAGQFVHIRLPGFTLRRPISICEITSDSLRLVFEVRGDGTRALADCTEGDSIDLLGPLGNGFPPCDSGLIVIGGGIGVPPLLETAGAGATAILGFRTADAVILADDFRRKGCDVRLATDDGTAGHHGLVTDLLTARLAEGSASLLCACGPLPMLKAVVAIAQVHNLPTQVSLEERMGCGVGACLVCACKTVKDGREIYSHVCKDGPVFDGKEVVFS